MEYREIGEKLEEYCKRFHINPDDFFEIINDQKVVPNKKCGTWHNENR